MASVCVCVSIGGIRYVANRVRDASTGIRALVPKFVALTVSCMQGVGRVANNIIGYER